MKIHYSQEFLEQAIESRIRKSGVKLSDLFLIFKSDEEAEFDKILPDVMLKSLKDNLKKFEFDRALIAKRSLNDADSNVVLNYKRFDSELSHKINTDRIKVFFVKDAPFNALCNKNLLNYPQISRVSVRPFSNVNGKESSLMH